jgi:hypothetical protein
MRIVTIQLCNVTNGLLDGWIHPFWGLLSNPGSRVEKRSKKIEIFAILIILKVAIWAALLQPARKSRRRTFNRPPSQVFSGARENFVATTSPPFRDSPSSSRLSFPVPVRPR